MSGPQLDAVLRWVAAEDVVRRLAAEIREAATRIEALVSAVKGFTHMDQALVAESIDLNASLTTIVVLNAKARAKSVSIGLDVEGDLPHVRGFAGEISQVWANVIDNALDAVSAGGRVEVTARRARGRVVVRVIDNGSGIPPEIRARIFEPFTTKSVGQGTGLGLDIVRRLVSHNDGDIDVESEPGRTVFSVSLPISARGRPRGIDPGRRDVMRRESPKREVRSARARLPASGSSILRLRSRVAGCLRTSDSGLTSLSKNFVTSRRPCARTWNGIAEASKPITAECHRIRAHVRAQRERLQERRQIFKLVR